MTWVKELLNVPAREVFSQERTYELGLERAHEKEHVNTGRMSVLEVE